MTNKDNPSNISFLFSEEIKTVFTDLIIFGDSLADVGNLFLATTANPFTDATPASPPYFNGRFSNGKLVPEILADGLGFSASTPSLQGGNNYAFGAAETGSGLSDEGVPNVGEQIKTYLKTNKPTQTDVFFISAGSNNFFSDRDAQTIPINIPTPESALQGLTENIRTLTDAGAKNFIIPNLAPLGTLPLAQISGLSNTFATASTQFNTLLDSKLDELEDELNIDIIKLDVAREFDRILANPADFGLTNINEPALNRATGEIVNNPDEYFWWDEVHPTTAAYSLIAPGLAQDISLQTIGLINTINKDADGNETELIDLRGYTNQTVTAKVTIEREAEYDNSVYLYQVDNIDGGISVGSEIISPGQENYLQAALNAMIASTQLSVSEDTDGEAIVQTIDIAGGSLFGIAIVVDGTLAEAQSSLGNVEGVYLSYMGANTDNGSFDHIKFEDKTFKFEDLPNGGDRDFNDITLKMEFEI